MESETLQKNETRDELRTRLKKKINSKRTIRTNGTNGPNGPNGTNRKKSQNINNSLKKISEILTNKKVDNPEQIDSDLIETIMTTISKEDLELILDKMQENSKFKELLLTINQKLNNQ